MTSKKRDNSEGGLHPLNPPGSITDYSCNVWDQIIVMGSDNRNVFGVGLYNK